MSNNSSRSDSDADSVSSASTVSASSSVSSPSLELDIRPNASMEEKLASYSNALYEYTRQLWLESRRQAELLADRRLQKHFTPRQRKNISRRGSSSDVS